MTELSDALQSTLGSGYTVERELGGGGMSRVFVTTENRLNRRVVVKVLRPEIALGTSTERFEREMAACARCQHPHIVPLLTAGHVAGLPYFTMPFIQGESLRERLTRDGPLRIEEAIRFLTEIADALAYAHRQGVVHRDIKPENILIQDGHAVVADFGVAKALHLATGTGAPTQVTGVGMVIGTPAYMAPEQAMGDPGVDHRADLYALGVVGYELLTGQPPFGSMTPPALVAAQLSRTPPSVIRARADCPPALAALLTRLLARDPAERPSSGEEARNELQAIGEGLHAGKPWWTGPRFLAAVVTGAVVLAVGLFAISGNRGSGSETGAVPGSGPGIKSLAVMPFQNIGGDSTTDYFSQGLAEELINALGRLPGLRVASRTSSFAARARSADLREIGRRLDVGAILEATVQQIGPRVRVTARLVDVAQDAQLWSGDYRSELRDVFEVQDTIARAIASALRVTLAGAAGGSLVEQGTRDQEAHDHYLRGRYFLAPRTAPANRRAIEAFEAALARDSSYALAFAGLADAYALVGPFGGASPQEISSRARAAARRALELDATIAETHTSVGFVAMWIDWDLAEAGRRFDRAVELNPSSVQARLFRTWQLMVTGRTEESLAEIERARTLDPLSLIVNTRRGTMLHFAGRDQEAVAAFTRALELDSTFAFARAGLALSLAMLGRCQEALSITVPLEPLLGNGEAGQPGAVFARCGKPDQARQVLAELERLRTLRYVSAEALATVHAALGDRDAAFAELDRAVREHSFTLPTVANWPAYASFRSDPRWVPFLRRIGLAPEWSLRRAR